MNQVEPSHLAQSNETSHLFPKVIIDAIDGPKAEKFARFHDSFALKTSGNFEVVVSAIEV